MLAEFHAVVAGVACVWTPVRYVNAPQRCASCGRYIPKGSPGNSAGTRGTRAYFCRERNTWNCIPCRQEAYALDALNGQPGGVYP